MEKQSYLSKSRYLLLFLFALIVGSGSAWADTLTEDFESTTVSGDAVSSYVYNELSNGWKCIGDGTVSIYNGWAVYGLTSDYARSGKGLWSNSSSASTSYIVIPTRLTGTVEFYVRQINKNAASIQVFEAVVSGVTYEATGSALAEKTYDKISSGSASSTFVKLEVPLGTAGKMLAIQLVNAAMDDFSGTIYEDITGPKLGVYSDNEATSGVSSPLALDYGLVAATQSSTYYLKNKGIGNLNVAIEATGGYTVKVGDGAASASISAFAVATDATTAITIYQPAGSSNGTITLTATDASDDSEVGTFTINASGTVRQEGKVYEDFANGEMHYDWSSVGYSSGWTSYNWTVSSGYVGYNAISSSYVGTFASPKLVFNEGEKVFFETEKYSSSSSYSPSITIQYSTDGSSWTTIGSAYTDDTYDNWTQRSVTIPTASAKYIRFSGWYVKLRNIYGGTLPIEPKNLSVSRQGTSATMTWTAANTETAWQVFISTNENAINGDITPEDVATTPSYTFENLTVGSTYYAWVRSNFGGGSYSDWVKTSFSLIYTSPAPTSVDGSGITNVTFGTGAEVVNNSTRPTSSPYYGNYSAQIGAITVGGTAAVDITFETGYTYGTVIWVDWNQNYEFEESEVVFRGTSTNASPTTLNASFDVPALQAVGNYRMRIAAADSYYDDYITNPTTANYTAKNLHTPTGGYTVVHDYTLKVKESSAYAMSISGSDVSENTIAFGTVKNTTTTKTFTIVNDGDNALTDVSVVSSDNTIFTVSETDPFDIVKDGSKEITVTFVKGVAGDYSKKITISQANIATPIELTVTATYQAPTPATMNVTIAEAAVGETVAFGTVNKATTKTFKVSNTGESTLNATIGLSGANADKFTLSTTSLEVAGGANETFTVTFDSDDEDVAKTATVTLSAAGLDNVAFNVTGTYSNFWTEDFAAGTLPTGWVITPGSYSGDTYAWHIGTFSDYENKTSMAIAPTSTTYNTIITPRLAAKKDDVLNWDAYFNWSDEYMTVEWSNDGQTGWTTIYDQYKPTDESVSTRYYHKEMSFTAPADGNYYLRFTSRYSNGIDNFSGFKLNPKTHDASITAKSIPATGNQYVEYTATVTVNELLGKDDEVVTAELWIGTTKVATEADVTLNASTTKLISLSFTPATAMSGDAYIKVYNGDESINLTSDVQAVTIAAATILDETVDPTITGSVTLASVVVKYTPADGWNTIAMPFALTDDILTDIFGAGYKIYEFKSFSENKISFATATTFYAGYPYLVYVENAPAQEDIKLQSVSVVTAKADTYGGVTFQSSYAPIAAGDLTGNYGVTSDGEIRKAGSGASLNGFRAYFTDVPASARIFIDGEATGIGRITADGELQMENVYNLNGQKVQNAQKGLYIVNGKKVVIK